MDKKKRKVYTPAEKRRRNRRHNAIVTSIAVVLMLAGIIIIVSDTTFFFDDAGVGYAATYSEEYSKRFRLSRQAARANRVIRMTRTILTSGRRAVSFRVRRFRRTKRPCPKMLRKNRSFTIMRPNAFIFRNMI